jgi:hypothetical protein
MENIEYRQKRRSTTGRSNTIESCINTLTDALKDNQFDLEDISTLVINNNLPSELRPVAWEIFLGILPKEKDLYEWVKIIQAERAKFEKISSDKEIEDYTKVIRKETNESSLTPGKLLADYQNVAKEIEKISSNYDFFKSQIVAETLLRLYVIWKKNNPDPTDNNSVESFYILAGVIYALYPSILHFNTEIKEINKKEDVDPRTLFYFLNNEEYFDSDVYMIFDHIMNKLGFESFIVNFSKLGRQEWENIYKNIVQGEDEEENSELFKSEESKTLISNMNRLEKISYPYLKVANRILLSHFFSINLDPYHIVQTWFTSLLTNSICFEHLTYLWDNIFLYSQNQGHKFEFLDYILVALISNLSNDLLISDVMSAKKILMRYPEHNLNLKDIVKKALKLREKISENKALHQ